MPFRDLVLLTEILYTWSSLSSELLCCRGGHMIDTIVLPSINVDLAQCYCLNKRIFGFNRKNFLSGALYVSFVTFQTSLWNRYIILETISTPNRAQSKSLLLPLGFSWLVWCITKALLIEITQHKFRLSEIHLSSEGSSHLFIFASTVYVCTS